MPKHNTQRLTRFLTAFALAASLATPAAAGVLYRWSEPDGSVSFTDDPQRIPVRHRAGASKIQTGGLASYPRYTPRGDNAAQREYAKRLSARLERLREFNQPAPIRTARPAVGTETVLRIDESTLLTLPEKGQRDGEPVIVEELRVRDPHSITTRHVTVVRQGDEVLTIVRPRSSVQSASPPSEADLLSRR